MLVGVINGMVFEEVVCGGVVGVCSGVKLVLVYFMAATPGNNSAIDASITSEKSIFSFHNSNICGSKVPPELHLYWPWAVGPRTEVVGCRNRSGR